MDYCLFPPPIHFPLTCSLMNCSFNVSIRWPMIKSIEWNDMEYEYVWDNMQFIYIYIICNKPTNTSVPPASVKWTSKTIMLKHFRWNHFSKYGNAKIFSFCFVPFILWLKALNRVRYINWKKPYSTAHDFWTTSNWLLLEWNRKLILQNLLENTTYRRVSDN